MKAIPVTPMTVKVARRIVWFEEPEKALADPVRFMAYAMTYARHRDMQVIRQYVSDDDFRQALDRAPPGIIDPRSWAYWNLKMGRFPPPPLRKRAFNHSGAAVQMSGMEERRRAAAQQWRGIRGQGSPVDAEDARRRAVEEWREKYDPGERS